MLLICSLRIHGESWQGKYSCEFRNNEILWYILWARYGWCLLSIMLSLYFAFVVVEAITKEGRFIFSLQYFRLKYPLSAQASNLWVVEFLVLSSAYVWFEPQALSFRSYVQVFEPLPFWTKTIAQYKKVEAIIRLMV